MDRYRLEYIMKSKGICINQMCKDIGISRAAYYRKTRGLSEFTQSEIQHICDYLEIENPVGIFFT